MPDKTAAYHEPFRSQNRAFVATVELADGPLDARSARVTDLGFHGCYLSMSDGFLSGASVLVKIRTETEFFQCQATVTHANSGIGMAVLFREISPPFQLVLLQWISAAAL